MAAVRNRAPRGTRALIATIMDALDAIPETQRKAAFRHAAQTVREKLIAHAENAKVAARAAPARPGAKMAAAVAATRKASREDAARRGGARSGRTRKMAAWTH